MDRNSTLIAFGGGVIGDLSGFVAATFMRGISWIQVPTTLLAQVDASVGGKTAINQKKEKNMVGAFHQPSLVLIDVDTLHDLAERDVVSGLAEIIKHGVIMNEPLFSLIEKNLTKILRLVPEVLIEIIAESCANKAYVVENDEKENGLRSTLNYGHTFAHALEVLTDYNTFRHGEAVAVGMNCAAQLSVHLGMLDPCELDRQNTLLQNAGLPIQIPRIQSEKFLEAMYLDKKTSHGKLKLILIEEIGKVKIRTGIPDNEILTVIEKCTTN
jgi:3-dehydroquinate synthase